MITYEAEAGAIEPFNFKTAKSCCPDNNKATCDPLTDVRRSIPGGILGVADGKPSTSN